MDASVFGVLQCVPSWYYKIMSSWIEKQTEIHTCTIRDFKYSHPGRLAFNFLGLLLGLSRRRQDTQAIPRSLFLIPQRPISFSIQKAMRLIPNRWFLTFGFETQKSLIFPDIFKSLSHSKPQWSCYLYVDFLLSRWLPILQMMDLCSGDCNEEERYGGHP